LSTAQEVEGGLSLKIALTDENKNERTDTGYHVRYDLRKSVNGAWTRVGEVMDEPTFSVPLLDGDGKSVGASGFYRVTTLIVPDGKTAVTNEIPSTNIVGVLEVASTLANTLAAVPWVSLAADPATAEDNPVSVSKYLYAGHIENNDSVLVPDGNQVYRKWIWDQGGKNWSGVTTVAEGLVEQPSDAASYRIGREKAVWITRSRPTSKPIFLIGQYSAVTVELTIPSGTREKPAYALIPNPSLDSQPINGGYDWGLNPVEGDVIRIPNEKEAPHLLTWNGTEWGRIARIPGERVGKWKNDYSVGAGVGFWYKRTGAEFKVTLPKSVPADDTRIVGDN
jgi:hypothetical protein